SGGYRVQRTYEVETEEGIFEVQVTAAGSESKTREYEGRQWHIILTQTRIQNAQLSDRAKELQGLREQSSQFLEDWGNKLTNGQLGAAYLATRTPAERAALAQALGRRRALFPALALGASSGVPAPASEVLVWGIAPEIDELAREGLPDYAS